MDLNRELNEKNKQYIYEKVYEIAKSKKEIHEDVLQMKQRL
jgi:hypothetical protein